MGLRRLNVRRRHDRSNTGKFGCESKHCADTQLSTSARRLESGRGVWLQDAEGQRYLDFAAGIAVCALGHGHPALTRAINSKPRHCCT